MSLTFPLPLEEEQILAGALADLPWSDDTIGRPWTTIMNLRHCSQTEARFILHDLQERSVVEARPENFDGRISEAGYKKPRWKWYRL
jgi:hypothetical protein